MIVGAVMSGTFTDHLFIGAGMNWHLFDTMDVLKYSTGDTVHLSVAPLVNLNAPPMLNNEQMEIPDIPFPNYFNDEVVTYGVLDNTNIGYIYVVSDWPSAPANVTICSSCFFITKYRCINNRYPLE